MKLLELYQETNSKRYYNLIKNFINKRNDVFINELELED